MDSHGSRRQYLQTLGAGAIAGVFAGCSGDGGSGDTTTIRHASAPGAELTDLASMFHQSEHIQENVMENAGDAYETEVVFLGGSPQIVNGLAGNEAELGIFAFSSAANAINQGTIDGGFRIVAPAKYAGVRLADKAMTMADSDIESITDLEGKSLGVQAVGSAVDTAARVALLDAGLDPEEDVSFREVSFGAMPSALREGRVDATMLIQPFISMMGDEVREVFSSDDAFGNYMELGIGGRNEFIDGNEDALRAWLEDYWTALQWWSDEANHDQVVDIAAEITELDAELLEGIVQTEQGYYHGEDGMALDAACLQVPADGMARVGHLEAEVDVTDYVDDSYLPAAATESGVSCQ